MLLFCVLLVHPLPEPFSIDISEENPTDNGIVYKDRLSFSHIKKLILNILKESPTVYKNVSEVKTLWRIEELAEGNDKWEILEKIVKEFNDETDTEHKLKELDARKLLSSNYFKDEFTAELPKRKVHIIIQPSSPATTGKCLPMVYLSNKKFAVKIIIDFDLISFFSRVKKQVPPSEALHKVQYLFVP